MGKGSSIQIATVDPHPVTHPHTPIVATKILWGSLFQELICTKRVYSELSKVRGGVASTKGFHCS